ncbi:MAG TPA: phosphate acyltransferase, partial [Lachnospiraceae bacterium]|nr:phosphate acyltransferase [Lachnospiraceae bacterium]
MAGYVNVALDAMGGDNAPVEIVKGAVDAVRDNDNVKVYLVGDHDAVARELSKYTFPDGRIETVDSTEVIGMDEAPVMAIRKKRDSSLVKALNLVKEGKCDAFVSAGSTG